jgi:hypothetical protein
MAEQGDWIDFREVISNYTRGVREFHSWFWGQVSTELNLAEYTGKAEELRLWLSEKDVKPDWLGTNLPIPSNWNEICRSELRKKRITQK